MQERKWVETMWFIIDYYYLYGNMYSIHQPAAELAAEPIQRR